MNRGKKTTAEAARRVKTMFQATAGVGAILIASFQCKPSSHLEYQNARYTGRMKASWKFAASLTGKKFQHQRRGQREKTASRAPGAADGTTTNTPSSRASRIG